ncbi:MAG: YdeI/OmpD-associated family protein [Nostoc sp. EkiNYC01]
MLDISLKIFNTSLRVEKSFVATTNTQQMWQNTETNFSKSQDSGISKVNNEFPTFCPNSREEWRQWLETNHHTSSGVWLIYYKVKSGKPSVRYSEAVKEALCFGWIDSKVKSLDEERYMQIFTPRKPKSVWSKLNKQYIEELIEQGFIAKAGLEKIAVAKQNGSWNSLDAIEALIIPLDLSQALEASKTARDYFEAFSNSSKKNILFWIESAKRPETRLKRIEQTVHSAVQNKSPLVR